MYSLRLASGGSIGTGTTGLGFALGRFGGRRGGAGAGAGAAQAAGGLLARPAAGRSVSATPNAAAPVPGNQGVGSVGMEQGKQQPPPLRDAAAAAGEQQGGDTHKQTTEKGDVMTHSFGEGYSTRSDEEGFGGVYGRNDPVFNWSGGDVHPDHPDYDRSQGSEVKEKEKARHLKDDKHAA